MAKPKLARLGATGLDNMMDPIDADNTQEAPTVEVSSEEQEVHPAEEVSSAKSKSNANLRTRSKTGRSGYKYMSLDIFGYEDYLHRMAKYATEQESNRIKAHNKAVRKDKSLTEEEKKAQIQRATTITRTKYILDLIQADMEKNHDVYEALKGLSAYDIPPKDKEIGVVEDEES